MTPCACSWSAYIYTTNIYDDFFVAPSALIYVPLKLYTFVCIVVAEECIQMKINQTIHANIHHSVLHVIIVAPPLLNSKLH